MSKHRAAEWGALTPEQRKAELDYYGTLDFKNAPAGAIDALIKKYREAHPPQGTVRQDPRGFDYNIQSQGGQGQPYENIEFDPRGRGNPIDTGYNSRPQSQGQPYEDIEFDPRGRGDSGRLSMTDSLPGFGFGPNARLPRDPAKEAAMQGQGMPMPNPPIPQPYQQGQPQGNNVGVNPNATTGLESAMSGRGPAFQAWANQFNKRVPGRIEPNPNLPGGR